MISLYKLLAKFSLQYFGPWARGTVLRHDKNVISLDFNKNCIPGVKMRAESMKIDENIPSSIFRPVGP